jgi:hypothetical protein
MGSDEIYEAGKVCTRISGRYNLVNTRDTGGLSHRRSYTVIDGSNQ